MSDERFEELAALDALGLLEGAEHAELTAMLERDAALRRRAAELREAAARLAFSAPAAEPPAELKARILASARNAAAPETRRSKLLSFPVLAGWAVAACLAVALVRLGGRYETARFQNEILRQQQHLADLDLRAAQAQREGEHILSQQQLADVRRQAEAARQQVAALDQKLKTEGDVARFKIATLASMLGNSPAALAVAVWDPARQQGVLKVDHLPALAADKDYQLWVIDPQYPDAVDGGVFQVDPATGEARINFKAGKPIKSIAKFAVSLERKGGVRKAQGPIVLLSE